MKIDTVEGTRRLLIGCGHDVRAGWVNLDIADLPGVDVIHDLDAGPMPFPDASFDHVEATDVLEHVRDLPAVMAELHRVLAPGGSAHITGPHFSSYVWPTDPTHRRAFAINTFEFFARGSFLERGYYFDFAFETVERRRIGFRRTVIMPWNYLMEPLVNLHRRLQTYYEATGWCRLFPAHSAEFLLRK